MAVRAETVEKVYECIVRGVHVMLRKSDEWVNATQILKVAGISKDVRPGLLKQEIIPGEHHIVDGHGNYKGVWVPLERGRELATKYGVRPLLDPLFDFIQIKFKSAAPAQPDSNPPLPPVIRIYKAVYESVQVYECMLQGVALMLRRLDCWVNATQILKLAGLSRTKSDEIIRKELLRGPHERVKGKDKDSKFCGVWIPLERGRELATQFGVAGITGPLFDFPALICSLRGQSQLNGLPAPHEVQQILAEIDALRSCRPSSASQAGEGESGD
ncbi:apses-domain-containing protein [Auricularia subglabra TFB-10046 SS5]|nr:apses-domain-containing protein [Auricularia subglabra TFB-10046 SS5]